MQLYSSPNMWKNYYIMRYSAGDDLVFKMIFALTKDFVNILKMSISSINLTIWLEFLKLDFYSRDMKIQR